MIEDVVEGDGEQPVITVQTILETENILEMLSDEQVAGIGQQCLTEFEADLRSRREGDEGACWEDRYKRYLDVAMQVRKAKTFPWPNASNVKFPVLTTAAVQFQARAYPAIVDGANLVKGRVLGDDSGIPEVGPDGQPIFRPPVEEGAQPEPVWQVPPGAKRDRADRIGEHMTWQLMFDMPGWEEDTDRLLLMLPIVGSVFRKTYYDSIQQRNVSRMVNALDFVINYWATSIDEAPRFTQVLRFYPYEVEERFRSGVWRVIPLPYSQTPEDQSDTAPIEFLEQHCRIDLDEDGYPEPYIVTLTREGGHVVRIVPCFDADGVTMNMTDQTVIRIERKNYFVKYGFIPSPDGAFYDIGFGALLDDITASIDSTLNQLLDAGALQNAQGGFVGAGVNMRSGDLRFRLGEWKRMDVAGGTLRENIVPLNMPGPSGVLFNLLELLIAAAEKITSSGDALSGVSSGTEKPTTLLARIEQAGKVMNAIFKRIHRSFGKELRILFALNRDFLDERAFYALTDQPGEIGRADYEDKDIDVIPVSDPTMVNDAQKVMKAEALLAFNGDPQTNQEEIRRRYFDGTGQSDVDALMRVPPPQPDPKLLIEGARQANERDKTVSEVRKNDAAAAASLMSAAATARQMGLLPDAATLSAAAVRIAGEAAAMEDDGGSADQGGGVASVEAAPGDEAIPEISGGSPNGTDGAVGEGARNVFIPASGGGDAGDGRPSQI